MHTCFYTVYSDETWTERFSSSCELYEGLDLICTLVWLAPKTVSNADETISEKSTVSCQDEFMVNYQVKYVCIYVYIICEGMYIG